MINKLSFNSNFSKFFFKVALNKLYVKILKDKMLWLFDNKKKFHYMLVNPYFSLKSGGYCITHIVEIFFSKTNSLVSILSFSGKLILFSSAGNLFLRGKQKKFKSLAFKFMKHLLHWKVKSLKMKIVALHLKNVKFMKYWIIRQLKKKLFIQIVKNFINHPHNGCWKKKVRRKKRRNGWEV